MALWHLITTPFADVAILAASRDQAGKLLQQLTGYIKRSDELRKKLRITQRVVHCDQTNGKVAVLAADADTLDGWGGTLALVHELAPQVGGELRLLRDGLGPRDGQLVAFSTSGDDEESALGRLRASAHDMGLEADPDNPKHRHVRRGGFAFHEWALDNAEEADDLERVLLANPASWLTEAELCTRRDSPSMQAWQWQRFTCGLWVAGEESGDRLSASAAASGTWSSAPSTGRSSWCRPEKASFDSDSIPTARSTRKPSARSIAKSSSTVLPIPGSPRRTSARLWPFRTSSSSSSSRAHSSSRPINTASQS